VHITGGGAAGCTHRILGELGNKHLEGQQGGHVI